MESPPGVMSRNDLAALIAHLLNDYFQRIRAEPRATASLELRRFDEAQTLDLLDVVLDIGDQRLAIVVERRDRYDEAPPDGQVYPRE